MPTGKVTASTLRIRSAADLTADTIDYVHAGTPVDILDAQGDWTRVLVVDQGVSRVGWAASAYIAVDPAPVAAPPPPEIAVATVAAAPAGDIPPADDVDHPVTTHDDHAFGPDGVRFALAWQVGYASPGVTAAHDWIAANAADLGLADSVRRVIQAVSLNEGRFEAINSYDSAFMSLGLFQWTAGSGNDPGELAGLLDKVKSADADAFQTLFRSFGLDCDITGGGILKTGVLTLNGAALATKADKQQLRGAAWAYRFWRAGHHPVMRTCQVALAADRVSRLAEIVCDGRPLTAWLTSECGVALLLDEHVNRPGAVATTLQTALSEIGPAPDPTNWADADEAVLIEAYIKARDDTPMTDPDKRAQTIKDAAARGDLSVARGSFKTP